MRRRDNNVLLGQMRAVARVLAQTACAVRAVSNFATHMNDARLKLKNTSEHPLALTAPRVTWHVVGSNVMRLQGTRIGTCFSMIVVA